MKIIRRKVKLRGSPNFIFDIDSSALERCEPKLLAYQDEYGYRARVNWSIIMCLLVFDNSLNLGIVLVPYLHRASFFPI